MPSPTDPDDVLWQRGLAAMVENRRLLARHAELMENLTDSAAVQTAQAREVARWLGEADLRCARTYRFDDPAV